eukprot:gene549-biopygen461
MYPKVPPTQAPKKTAWLIPPPTTIMSAAGRDAVAKPPYTSVNNSRFLYEPMQPTSPAMAALGASVNEVAHAMWEPSAWEQRMSPTRSFRFFFCEAANLPAGLDAIPLFLEARSLKSSTKLQYGE